ncbi:spexin prohormone 2 isoform X1 [Xyrichtys novacula]|uniref:Spexin prohormone 2 isoform X1 n=1 Tax=Xyrichtys novacula TaxID=13765 RepID=A0AAV1F967_XYRNO|nr:spexin prohormone 2 isoform X1 [Xyrichtys novacula]
MDSPGTELDPAQEECLNVETDCSFSKEGGQYVLSKPAGAPMLGGPSSAFSLPGEDPPPQQQGIHTMMGYPQNFGFLCPYHSSQSQTASNYPQSHPYYFLPGPGPGLSNSSHMTYLSAPWFPYEPGLNSSMMTRDAFYPVAGPFDSQAVDPQRETPHHTPPVLCNEERGGQEMLAEPCESGPVFYTLTPASILREEDLTQRGHEEQFTYNFNVFRTPDQLPMYMWPALPLFEYRDQSPSMVPETPPQRLSPTVDCEVTSGNPVCRVFSRKPCRCARSRCLKLYCECFANGLMCYSCECSNCFNNPEHVMERREAIKVHAGRNPDAFKTKIVLGGSGEVEAWLERGCKCKRSGCLKNYCQCYEANVRCTPSCKCSGCRNFKNKSETGESESTTKDKDNCPGSVITHEVVEAVFGSLLARAERAAKEGQSSTQAEQEVLEEFGQCMAQIVKAMFE